MQAQRELTKLCRLSDVFWNERHCVVQVTCFERVEYAGGELNSRRKQNGGEGGKRGYIYSSSSILIHILRFVG